MKTSCRYAYSHSGLVKNLNYDFETESRNTFEKVDNAVKLTDDEEIVRWCLELVDFNDFEELLVKTKERYPILTEKYFEYINQKNENIEETNEMGETQTRLKYAKITIENIKSLDENSYFDVVDPMWGTISIYDGYDEYIQSAQTFTLEQRYLLAITWYFSEVCNGGHYQFLYNPTGIVWEDAIKGFKHFGMNEYADNFQKVVDYCGGTISFGREERYHMLEILEEKYGEEFFKILDEADDFIYDYEGEENELNYIKSHPEKFVFEGEYESFYNRR